MLPVDMTFDMIGTFKFNKNIPFSLVPTFEFINNTPAVTGFTLITNFMVDNCFRAITCVHVQESTTSDCESSVYVHTVKYLCPTENWKLYS